MGLVNATSGYHRPEIDLDLGRPYPAITADLVLCFVFLPLDGAIQDGVM